MPRLSESQPSAYSHTQCGFTLIELMIIIALVGIIAAIAIPNFSQFINKNRTQSLNNEMLALVQYARTTAVEQKTFMRVCKESGRWTVKKTCADSAETLRRLDVPSGSTVNPVGADVAEVLFRYNGTSKDTTLITCQGTDHANGYTIEVKASGSVRSWPRGMANSTTSMTACQ